MSDAITLTIDEVEVTGRKGQTILQAADDAGLYIPRLCWVKKLKPGAACRLCTVMVNNRPVAACTQPITEGMIVLHDTEPLNRYRRNLIDMMFVEGNHLCPVCEKSGNCELQALAYRFGITAPKYPYLFPRRPVDASHPDIFLDQNRCIQCGRCVRASQELDGKSVFQFFGRGAQKKLGVNAEARLADTSLNLTDEALNSCPVGALLRKRVGYAIPVGQRLYDLQPIGSEIEAKARRAANRK